MKEEQKMPQVQEQAFPWSTWCRAWWVRLCLCSPWECPVEQRSTCGEAHIRASGDLKEGCDLVTSSCWSLKKPWTQAGPVYLRRRDPMLEWICCQDLWPHREAMLEQYSPEGLHPMKGSYSEQFVMHCSPWEGEVCETVCCGRDPTLEQGKEPSSWGGNSSKDYMW